MSLTIELSERILLKGHKRWERRILGIIQLSEKENVFPFGRNEPTKTHISNINNYGFLSTEEAIVSGSGGNYVLIPKGRNPLFLRKELHFFFINFGLRETRIEKNESIQIQKGDSFVIKGPSERIELILEIVNIM